jgi:hypothetical protein
MAIETVSFSPKAKGWNTFHSFIPDWMIGMNSSLYTWKNGDLYLHYDNSSYNKYYGVHYDSTLTTIFNEAPDEAKIFKTICLEGNDPWKADITTDLGVGVIEADYFVEKESDFYGYIRRADGALDVKMLSTQGIGELASIASTVLTFSFDFNTVSVGDNIYIVTGSVFTLIGEVATFTSNTITVVSVVNAPSPTDFIVTAKSSVAESYSPRGYYMEVELTNTKKYSVELFSISTEVAKSSP